MARWDGTSFSAPLVAGLIGAEISRTGNPASVAKDAVLATAREVPGVGPALFSPDLA
jgi:subtilisin family serine protease